MHAVLDLLLHTMIAFTITEMHPSDSTNFVLTPRKHVSCYLLLNYWQLQNIKLFACQSQVLKFSAILKDWGLSLVTNSCGSEFHSLMAVGRRVKYGWVLIIGWARDVSVMDL